MYPRHDLCLSHRLCLWVSWHLENIHQKLTSQRGSVWTCWLKRKFQPKFSKFVVSNPIQSFPFLTILVPLWFIIISLVNNYFKVSIKLEFPHWYKPVIRIRQQASNDTVIELLAISCSLLLSQAQVLVRIHAEGVGRQWKHMSCWAWVSLMPRKQNKTRNFTLIFHYDQPAVNLPIIENACDKLSIWLPSKPSYILSK